MSLIISITDIRSYIQLPYGLFILLVNLINLFGFFQIQINVLSIHSRDASDIFGTFHAALDLERINAGLYQLRQHRKCVHIL